MATTYLKQSNMDQPHKVAKPARGQLCIRGKYIDYICTGTVLPFVLVCIPGTSIFFTSLRV